MPKIAIVGAGPSGCYAAQALLKIDKTLEVDILDRLPVPYGLVRYGVAPDHQGTKAVARQFARLFERQGVRFIGNVTLGETVTLDALRAAYDIVVLALGLSKDRPLDLPGGDLGGVSGAGAVTRHWNDHPDEAGQLPHLGNRVVIVGQGNVAMDVLRILAKQEPDFDGSDLHPRHTDHITGAGVAQIDILGRSPAHLAKFDPVMVKELAKLEHVRFALDGLELSEGHEDDPRVAALAALPQDVPVASHAVTFRFGWTPERLSGTEGHVDVAFFRRGDEELGLSCNSVITAIGFDSHIPGLRDDLLARAEDAETGVVDKGLYLAGWFCRGPRGTIPDNRAAAQALATRIMADLGTLTGAEKPGHAALIAAHPDLTDYDGWLRIDAAELAACTDGRVRAKVADLETLLALASGRAPGSATPETEG
jgi:ferredoxin/flavodoxin---NADP+ reductase